ncbi:MAG TPA: hypothetical protein VG756_08750 [Pseudonocardiaceae bacterium]|nr:hypothetical protein [Pseudonocardiaceae bacterium]
MDEDALALLVRVAGQALSRWQAIAEDDPVSFTVTAKGIKDARTGLSGQSADPATAPVTADALARPRSFRAKTRVAQWPDETARHRTTRVVGWVKGGCAR